MKNENSLIGLFQGMFDKNILTFNPGFDSDANKLEKFDDVREIQKQLKTKNVKIETEADPSTNGPASITLIDPDVILNNIFSQSIGKKLPLKKESEAKAQ